MTNNQRVIICLVGPPSSGKDTASAYLIENYGFEHVSTSDLIRSYVAEHQLGEMTRALLQKVGNQIREKYGPDYLAKLALKNTASNLIISGVRSPAEAQAIREAGGVMVAITVPLEIRYQRALARNRIGEHITFEAFRQREEAETSNEDARKQNLTAVIAQTDYTVSNSGSKADFQKEIDHLLQKIHQS